MLFLLPFYYRRYWVIGGVGESQEGGTPIYTDQMNGFKERIDDLQYLLP